MSVSNLDALFRPTSVAVIDASNEPRSPGSVVMRNLLAGRFLGPVMPVTERFGAVSGVLTYKSIDTLPVTPELAVLCGDPEGAPGHLRALGRRGTRAAILLGAGFAGLPAERRGELERETLEAARQAGMRILGPGCMGLVAPGAGLNASLAPTDAQPGRIAFITQSDSLFTAVLDWAKTSGVGFSHFISLGDQLDVNFASVLDWLGSDPQTRSILLYVESICDARRFMSAARASARNKPILVIKPGRGLRGYQVEDACIVDREAAGDQDPIYDVAFRRAGIVRVGDIDALFDGARTLARSRPLIGDGLAILTNGRSVGLLAADALICGGGRLAALSPETLAELAKLPGGGCSGRNPVDMPFDAGAKVHAEALKILIKDPDVAAVLVLHVPFAEVPSDENARAVTEALAKTKRAALTCWMGSKAADAARKIFAEGGVPSFETPDKAITSFLHMVSYRRNQELLLETPDSLPADFFPDTDTARSIVKKALDDGRAELSETESRDVLAAYGVPVIETRVAVSAKDAVIAADDIGYPVALKIRSRQIPQPFLVGGVVLDLETPEQVWDACATMVARVHKHVPDAYIDGFTVQQMGRRLGAHELFVGAFCDPVFGPVVRFGHGGMAKNIIQDEAVALPPLNMTLARELIGRTRISRLLEGSAGFRPADVDDVCLTLIQVTQLVIDVPQVTELEVNPLFADDKGVLALGARVKVARTSIHGPDRLAIRPYPRELEECVTLKGGMRVMLRPIRPEDAPAHFDFVKSLSIEDLRLRFFGKPREFTFTDMASFTQIDYDREMAFIATHEIETGEHETLGVVRASARPDNSSAEFAIIVRSKMKGQGLGALLFDKLIRYLKARGVKLLEGQTLPENKGMIGLARKFGFEIKTDFEDDIVNMKLPLNP